ncbi:hypothetical protein BDF22DRAFT_307268 [Syncephalis plumigaleata]|nr:hypothetical protein BDF22DRAFT_307268 [Syncephalis plumigaleata]
MRWKVSVCYFSLASRLVAAASLCLFARLFCFVLFFNVQVLLAPATTKQRTQIKERNGKVKRANERASKQEELIRLNQ